MLGFFKRSKDQLRVLPAEEPKPNLQSVLIWVDESYRDPVSRVVRALALEEAYRDTGLREVHLVCPTIGLFTHEASQRGINVSTPDHEAPPLTLADTIQQLQPDIVVADLLNPPVAFPRTAGDKRLLFVLLCDRFHETALGADMVILPGCHPAPTFESLRLQPSRLADCLHGWDVVPLPKLYEEEASSNTSTSCIVALSSDEFVDHMLPLEQTLKTVFKQSLSLLDDSANGLPDKLKGLFDPKKTCDRESTLKDRRDMIDQANVVLTHTGPHMYEFLARGKNVILYTTSESEWTTAQWMQSQLGGVMAFNARKKEGDELDSQLKSVLDAPEIQKRAENNAEPIIKKNGAAHIASLTMDRWFQLVQ